jgi:hypothetical protein
MFSEPGNCVVLGGLNTELTGSNPVRNMEVYPGFSAVSIENFSVN